MRFRLPRACLLQACSAQRQQQHCIEVYTIDGSAIDCSFTTMAQCAATASGQSAQCYANPYYAMQNRQPGPGPSPPRRSR
jgi:hypothetical protein